MYYLAIITLITLLTLSLPWLSPKIANHYGKILHSAPVWLPVLAAFCWAIAGFLPDVHISSQTNTFQEHFVGGGMYSAILFIYFSKLLGWRPNWILSLLGLFAWTSALGVLNELVEFTVTKLNITHIDITDTSWDLMANTVGSLLVYIIWQIARLIGRRTNASYNKR